MEYKAQGVHSPGRSEKGKAEEPTDEEPTDAGPLLRGGTEQWEKLGAGWEGILSSFGSDSSCFETFSQSLTPLWGPQLSRGIRE